MVAPSESGSSGSTTAAPVNDRARAKANAAGEHRRKLEVPGHRVAATQSSCPWSKDNRFTWKYAHQKKTQSFDGKYELAGTALVLEYSNGGTMVGRVDAEGKDRFSFKMVGGPANDPGLVFSK